jgi:hypothetical protein
MTYIFVKLMGGVGNQLFQYAAGILQKKINSGTLVLYKAENNHDSTDYRYLFSQAIAYDGKIQCMTLYQENGFAFWNPEDYKVDALLLYGYFQNYNVLKPILPEFKNHILHSLEPYQKFNIVPKSGFIHVRRGDYLNLPDSHHIQSLEYYKKALSLMSDIRHWYLLSDDLEWCKSQYLFRTINVTYVNEDTLHSLAFMSMITEGAIIANSSFSWWGAYLGVGEKNVIYPKLWFSDISPDLFPEEWVGI